MSSVVLVFPHQLFEKHPALKTNKNVFLIEEFLFFSQHKFHKQKLIFHRASMKAYQHYLFENGYNVEYVEAHNHMADARNLFRLIKSEGFKQVHHCDTVDNYVERRIVGQEPTAEHVDQNV